MKKQIENEVLTSKENAKGVESQQIVNTKGEGSMLNNRQENMKNFREQLNVNDLKEVLEETLNLEFVEKCKCVDYDFIDNLVPSFQEDSPEFQNFHEAKGREIRSGNVIYSFSIYNVRDSKFGFRCKCYFELKNSNKTAIEKVVGLLVNSRHEALKKLCIRHFTFRNSLYDGERVVFRYCFSGEFVG